MTESDNRAELSNRQNKDDAFKEFELLYSAPPAKTAETVQIKPLDVPPVRENIVLRPKTETQNIPRKRDGNWKQLKRHISKMFE